MEDLQLFICSRWEGGSSGSPTVVSLLQEGGDSSGSPTVVSLLQVGGR